MLDINKLSNMKILIVDDQSDNLKVLYNTLNMAGYNISMAKTGQQAINHISDHQPDLILLDITLPDINGLDVCRTIKLDKRQKKFQSFLFLPILIQVMSSKVLMPVVLTILESPLSRLKCLPE